MASNPYTNKVVYGRDTLIDLTDTTATEESVASGEVFYKASGARATGSASYAGAATPGGAANLTAAIPYGEVDDTSTATAYTATVDGITALEDGVCMLLKNGRVTSASGFTININGLGAKPVYSNMATGNEVTPTNPTRDTTIFNINYTMLFVYSTTLVSGGAWICYRGYDANTNTIGYQLRTNSGNLTASDAGYRYRLWLTSADGQYWVPINTSTSTDATTARTLNTRKIDPFGAIVYNSTNGTVNDAARPPVGTLWQQYTLTVGYSYVLSMTAWKPVYLRCAPQTDGSAVMEELTQTLPSTADGKIYIYLGIAYSTTAMELRTEHPVFYHDGSGIRFWTGKAIPTKTSDLTNDSGFITDAGVTSFNGSTGAVTYTAPVTSVNGSTGAVTIAVPTASTTNPSMDGTASYGSGTAYARSNHVHPTDTSRQATLVSGTNIKTINGNSILGSGDLAISGGGVSVTTASVTIAASDWSSNTCTKSVSGVTASNNVLVTYAPASKAAYTAADIYCTAQGSGALTFACSTAPTATVTVNVLIID